MEGHGLEGLSRRALLAGLCVTAVAACSPAAQIAQAPAEKAAIAGQKLARGGMADWAARTGTEFAAAGFRLRVAGVRALDGGGDRPANLARSSAFLVVFDLLDGAAMPGDLIYAMAAPDFGPLDVFLTAAESTRMHAVFN